MQQQASSTQSLPSSITKGTLSSSVLSNQLSSSNKNTLNVDRIIAQTLPSSSAAPPLKEFANDEEVIQFNNACSLLNLIDTSSLPLEKKKSVEGIKSDIRGVQNTGRLDRKMSLEYIERVRNVLDSMEVEELKLDSKLSVKALKNLLSFSELPLEKKRSMSRYINAMDTNDVNDPNAMKAVTMGKKKSMDMLREMDTSQTLPRLSSVEILKSVLQYSSSPLDRKMSLEAFKQLLARPEAKALKSYDSFRFQKLANCLTEVEQEMNDIDNEEDFSEYVVQVDNLDSLLDDTASALSKISSPQKQAPSPPPPLSAESSSKLPARTSAAAAPGAMYSTYSPYHQNPPTNAYVSSTSLLAPELQPLVPQGNGAAMATPNTSIGYDRPVGYFTGQALFQYPMDRYSFANSAVQQQQVHQQHQPYQQHNSMMSPVPEGSIAGKHSEVGGFGNIISSNSSTSASPATTAATNVSTSTPQSKTIKFCSVKGCNQVARVKGCCKTHATGGGRRCKVEGCVKSAQTGNLCISHGGGKRCEVEGCTKTAQSRSRCKGHGGGSRCKAPGCTKSSQSGGFCRGHGGGARCTTVNCTKWAQRNGMCSSCSKKRSAATTIDI